MIRPVDPTTLLVTPIIVGARYGVIEVVRHEVFGSARTPERGSVGPGGWENRVRKEEQGEG